MKRLGRSDLPRPVLQTVRRFNCYAARFFPFSAVERRGVEDIVTDEQYMPYLINMPTESRKRHLQFLRGLRVPIGPFARRYDSAFTKSDEVLLCKKGRIIINPPPELFYQLVVGLTDIKTTLKQRTL